MIDLIAMDSVNSDMNYAKKCKQIRLALQMNQAEFAEVLGYGKHSRISEIENQKTVLSRQGKRCLDFLGMMVLGE